MGALFAEGGVVAVAGVEPGVVGEVAEDAFGDVVEQRVEVLGGGRAADAAREQRIPTAVKIRQLAYSDPATSSGCAFC